MSRRLAIFGSGGHGKVVAGTALESGWDEVVFFDDAALSASRVGEWRVLGGIDVFLATRHDYEAIIVAIGANRVRFEKTSALIAAGIEVASLIHPRAYIARDVRLGRGSVVLAGAIVQSGSIIGDGVIVNTAATVDHDCILRDGVHVCPGAHLAGCVSVGECAWLGIGCSVNQSLAIGADAVVGGGAAVVAPVPIGVTVVGVPARLIPRG